MPRASRTDQAYRVELYVRSDTYGTYDAQKRVCDRLENLEENATLEVSECNEWEAIETMEYETRDGVLATYEEFQDWARHNDVRLEPAFGQRFWSALDRTEVTEVVVFPVIALAVYRADGLEAVFPCTGDEHFTVQDCLAAFESANGDRFLSQFSSRTVERTAPHVEASV